MPGRPPSLTSISAFEAAARHQNFGKAADELNLTHGAVSHAVRSLEGRLRQPLFERRGRGVVLTEAGRIFAGRIRLGISLLSEAFETKPWLQRSRLVLSVLPALATRFLVPRLQRFREAHPEIALELRANWNLVPVEDGDVDIGLRYGPGGWAGFSAVRLAGEYLFPVISPRYGHPWPAAPEEMPSHELIGHVEFPWGPWLAAAGLDLPEPKCGFTLDDSLLALDAAASGAGIALARSLLAEFDLRSGRLIRLFDIQIPSNYAYWMVWNPVSPKMETIEIFRTWLTAEMASFTKELMETEPTVAVPQG
jgi:LysR family transcriptional regulator, glycine cleavage system transcriptional activator